MCGAVAVFIGVTVAVGGWLLGIDTLRRLSPGLATMKLNTAVCLALLGLAIVVGDHRPRLRDGLTLVVAAVSLVALVEYVSGWDVGIDELLVADVQGGTSYPGRMSQTTAVALLLCGGGLVATHHGLRRIGSAAAAAAFFAGYLGLLGYLFGVESLYAIGPFTTMAAHTAAAIIALSIGVLAAVPGGQVPWIRHGTDSGAAMLRRFLPLTFVGLPLLATVPLMAQRQGWIDTEAGMAIMVVAACLVATVVAVRSAHATARVEEEREEVLQRYHSLNAELEVRVAERTAALTTSEIHAREQTALLETILDNISDGVAVVDEHGNFLLFNPACLTILGVDEVEGGPDTWQDHYGVFLPDGVTPFPSQDQPLERALVGEPADQVPMMIRNPHRPGGVMITVSARPLRQSDGRPGAVSVFHDITSQHDAELALRADKAHSEAIATVAAAIAVTGTESTDVANIAAIAETVTSELAGHVADQASFTLFDPTTGDLNLLAIAGTAAAEGRQMMLDGPVNIDGPQQLAQAARAREILVIETVDPAEYAAQLPEPYRSFIERFPAYHIAHMPLLNGHELLGIITVVRFHPEPFDHYDLELTEQVALRAGWAMTKARHFERQARTELELRESQTVLQDTNRELEAAIGAATREREFSSMLLSAMHEGCLFTVEGEIRDVNDQLCAITGFSRDELIGRRRPYPFWPSDQADAYTRRTDQLDANGAGDVELDLVRRDGQQFPASVSIRSVPQANGSRGWITTVADITAFKQREEDLIAVAGRDPLTGLNNRRSIDEQFKRLRAGDAVILLDLDHFKTVNDTHGHAAGDRTLVTLATCITTTLRGKDWAGRLGGEEFIIVARDGYRDGAQSVVARLRDSWDATNPLTTFSAGIAVHTTGTEGHETLARADEALYAAKRGGRDRTETYTEPQPSPAAT